MKMYGIKNCDTVKKAKKFLDAQSIDCDFHDFKAEGLSKATLVNWLKSTDWEILLNRRGTTWRKLSDTDKETINKTNAIKLMLEQPTLIKRPVLEYKNKIYVGFDEAIYKTFK
tara:strand:+ start:40 stop:378 length:339 start_codon:yes stop_codon:yes gene_type:complete